MNVFSNKKIQIILGISLLCLFDGSLMSMDYFKAERVYGYYITDAYNTFRYFYQHLNMNTFIVVKEVLEGSNKGEKNVAVVLYIDDCLPMVLRQFDKDDAVAIATEMIRKFTNQHEKFIYHTDE